MVDKHVIFIVFTDSSLPGGNVADYTIEYRWIGRLEVEADSEEEALEIAKDGDPRNNFELDEEDFEFV